MAKKLKNNAYRELWANSKYIRGPLLIMELLRVITGLLIIGFFVKEIFPTITAVFVLVPLVVIVLIVFSKQVNKYYNRIEKRFFSNLNTDDTDTNRDSRRIRQQLSDSLNISPWDAHIVELKVRPYAQFVGKRLEKLAWREKYGINLAYIKRGDEIFFTPSRTSKLFPNDKVGIIATEEQMKIFKPIFDANPSANLAENSLENIVITSICVDENNKLKGMTIEESGIREKTNGLILGIERNNKQIFNPVSSTVFEWNDIVWISGERDKINNYIHT